MDWKSQTIYGFRCSASTTALFSEILVLFSISLQWVELLDGKLRQGIPKCNKRLASRFFASKVLMSCNIFDRTRQVLISSLDSKWKKKVWTFAQHSTKTDKLLAEVQFIRINSSVWSILFGQQLLPKYDRVDVFIIVKDLHSTWKDEVKLQINNSTLVNWKCTVITGV